MEPRVERTEISQYGSERFEVSETSHEQNQRASPEEPPLLHTGSIYSFSYEPNELLPQLALLFYSTLRAIMSK